MLDEAHFHLTDYPNPNDNPNEVHERPSQHNNLHSSKVMIWCAVSSHMVIGPYFFEHEKLITTVTSDR